MISKSALAPALIQVDETHVRYRGRTLIYFGGCDYLRLSQHPEVIQALKDGVNEYGLNVAASRKTTGNHPLYQRLELKLAKFFGAEASVLVSNGYAANQVVAQALSKHIREAFIDRAAHSSLVDSLKFLACQSQSYAHRNPEQVTRILNQSTNRSRRVLLLSDGVFAKDGSIAPLRQFDRCLPKSAWILVDDAHGAGVLGTRGRGTPEFEGVTRKRVIQTITLSKAFGAYGGAILGSRELRDRIIEKSSLFEGNTPAPLPLVAAALKSLEIYERDRRRRESLRWNVRYLKTSLGSLGLSVTNNPSPIISYAPRSKAEAKVARRHLLKSGIFPILIHYASTSAHGYFRWAISSEHTKDHLDQLIEAVAAIQSKHRS